MTILNLATIAKIQFIAECAHEDCALTTLKNAKEQITNRCKIFAGYESQWQGVDRAEVLAAFEQPMDCRTKSDFSRRLELLLETMQNMVIEHEKASEARRAAEAHQRTVMQYTGADFMDELYDAHTEALDEEHARNAEAKQVTFWGANDYAARRALVEVAHAEALEEDKARRLAARTGFTVEQCRAELVAEEGDVSETLFNLRAIVAEAHGEALKVNAAIDTELAILSSDIKGAHREFTGAKLSEVTMHYTHATHKRLIQNHGITLARDLYKALAQTAKPLNEHHIAAAHAEALEADKERTAHRLWGAYLNEDFAGRRSMIEAAHADALARDRVYNVMHSDYVDPVHRTAPAPAADIDAIDIRTLHEPIEAEANQPYAAKVVTRAYVARSIARALASYTKHYANYTAQDRLWLADHNANHAHRNGVITGEEYAAIYHLCRAEGADPLKLIDAVRVALLTGTPVMPAVNVAARAA